MNVTFFFTNIGPVLPKKQMRQGQLKVVLKKVDTNKPTDSFGNNEIKVVFFSLKIKIKSLGIRKQVSMLLGTVLVI